MEIFGEYGSIIYEGGKIVNCDFKGKEDTAIDSPKFSSSGASDPMSVDYRLHKLQIDEMVEAIHSDREPLVNGETAIKSLELISAIYESSKEKKLINLK